MPTNTLSIPYHCLLLQVVKLDKIKMDSPEGAIQIEMRPVGICVYMIKSYTLASNGEPESLEDDPVDVQDKEGSSAKAGPCF